MCDIWEKWVVWVEKSKTLLHKKEFNSEIWEKGVCDIWEEWALERKSCLR